MADDDSISEGVDSEDVADEEILVNLADVEARRGLLSGVGPAEDEVPADHRGPLYLKKSKKGLHRKGRKWKYYQVYLAGSCFYYYRPNEDNPKAVIQLHKLEVLDDVEKLEEGVTRPNSFALVKRKDKSPAWIVAAPSASAKAEWVEKIKANVDSEPAKPPKGAMRRKSSLLLLAKKKVGTKVATSGLGKKLIASVIADDQVEDLFQRCRDIIGRDKDPKFAETLENSLIKVAVKGIVLFRNGGITLDQASQLEPVVRKIGNQMKETWNDQIRLAKQEKAKQEAKAAENYDTLANLVRSLEKIMIAMYSGLVTQKTLDKIHAACDYFGVADTWKRLYEKEEHHADVEKVLERVSFYLHFY